MVFKKGDIVMCRNNNAWNKFPMVVLDDEKIDSPYSINISGISTSIRRCKHPTLGIGGFYDQELSILKDLTGLEKLIYNITI